MEKSKTTKREVFTKTGFILALVLCATPYVSAPIALVGGFLFTLFFGHPYAKSTTRPRTSCSRHRS